MYDDETYARARADEAEHYARMEEDQLRQEQEEHYAMQALEHAVGHWGIPATMRRLADLLELEASKPNPVKPGDEEPF